VIVPVFLREVDSSAQHLLECAVGAFGLTVGLRVVGGAHGECRSQLLPEGAPEVSGEARVAVGEDGLRHAMQADDLAEEDRCELRCGDGGGGGGVVNHLSQLVDEDDDGVVAAAGARQLCDEIHTDLLPWTVGHG